MSLRGAIVTAGRFDLAIFDCDGVLVDSEPIFNRAHAEILECCGFPIAPEALMERFCGVADAEMIAAIETEWGRPLPPDYRARVAVLTDAYCSTSLCAVTGVGEALARLGIPRCVASSGTPERVRSSLALTGLLGRFEPHIFSAVMVARGKPAPDLFLHAAHEMRAAPARCLVVEDSVAGVRAAAAAGMTVIGFCGGSHCPPGHPELLRRNGAALAICEMHELVPGIAALAGG